MRMYGIWGLAAPWGRAALVASYPAEWHFASLALCLVGALLRRNFFFVSTKIN